MSSDYSFWWGFSAGLAVGLLLCFYVANEWKAEAKRRYRQGRRAQAIQNRLDAAVCICGHIAAAHTIGCDICPCVRSAHQVMAAELLRSEGIDR